MTRQLKRLFAAACLCLLATVTLVNAQDKWSRQLEAAAAGENESLDWIPLAQAAESTATERAGRVLSYPQQYNAPQKPNYYSSQVQAQPQTQQSQFEFPFQFQRFGNFPQAQPLRQSTLKQQQQQEPTSQSFFKFEMPYHHGEAGRPLGAGGLGPTLQTGYQIQHGFGGQSNSHSSIFGSPLFNQQPLFPPEFHPLPQKPLQQRLQHQQQPQQQLQTKPLTQQNFIDDIFPLKSSLKETKPLPTQQSLQNVSPQVFPVDPQPESIFELNKPTSFQLQSPYQAAAPAANQQQANNAAQQQEVQLLYVPYDTLFNQQQQQQQQQQKQQQQPQTLSAQQNTQYDVNKFNFDAGLPAVNPYQINQFYTQDPLAGNFFTTSTTLRPQTTTTTKATSIKQNIFDSFASQFTTPKPKPKAHQPPLAMFILRNSARTTQADVVAALRQANTISVIDAPTKQTPEIFVGPAGMPIPNGYVKFDLPYLSQLAHTRDVSDVPFFVAPLSYRTPNGFNKILLPEPHVGSIVVNRAKDTQYSSQQQTVTAAPSEQPTYDLTTQRTRPSTTTKRIKQHPHVKDYFPDPFDVTTQRATLSPTRGNKFSYYYANEAIQEVTSPKIPKQERPKKKRPQTVQIEEDPALKSTLNNLYAQFNPIPNQIPNEDYFRVQTPQTKPTTTTTTSTTTTTTTSTPTPPALFTYNTSPQVEFKGTHGQLYHDFNKVQTVEPEYVPRFTTRPPPSTTIDDEYRMKQYFRQQDAFRNRPQLTQPTNAPFEQVQYTPVSQDYERQTTTQRPTTTTKQRVTIYQQPDTQENELPSNHRPAYNQNEINDSNVEYEPNPYQLPSELPPLTPNLPGLVNNLQEEKDRQNAIEQSTAPTQAYEPEPEPVTNRQPTRRPINRVRKPVVSKVTSSVSYSESESGNRRPSTRIRRPYGSRGTANTATESDSTVSTTTTTRRPTSARNNLLRNPNRIRYQPTPEERQTLRLKPKKHYGGSKKNENEDLEYQRDVLKQNYPVIKPLSSRKPTSPTAIPSSYAITTTESPAAETQQVYTVTPSNHLDRENVFPAGLLEQMDIAQQYNEYSKDNYGPGYFPNQEDLNPTEPAIRNEIYTTQQSLTTTTTTTTQAPTTTEEPQTTTRRSPFIRRNYPRLRTTTEAPATTAQTTEERASTRPRIPPRKVIKVRTRTRRPSHPASTTNPPEEENNEPEPQKNNYRKFSRYNQDNNENDPPRRRYKQQFQLDGQESQWSQPKVADSTNFKPVNPKERFGQSKHKFEDEPEIVTAGAEPETYEFNVGANYGPSATRTTVQEPNLKPEKSFAELLEEVMGKSTDETTVATPTTAGTYFESQKTTIANRIKERRAKWKKSNQRGTQESFETAESQNIGSQLANSLYSQNKGAEETAKHVKATTPSSVEATTVTKPITTTVATPNEFDATTIPNKQDVTTTEAYSTTVVTNLAHETTELPATTTAINLDSATRRMDLDADFAPVDDLETQPSLFSEVKRQLHELFAIEESEDQAVTAALKAVGRRRQEYTNIKRTKPDTAATPPMDALPNTEATPSDSRKEFHKDLMKNVVYATSQTTKDETPETEICYRGRCIRSEDLPPNHKLH